MPLSDIPRRIDLHFLYTRKYKKMLIFTKINFTILKAKLKKKNTQLTGLLQVLYFFF